MITREQVLDALKHIQEPTLHRSLVELNWVRDILLKEDRVALSMIVTSLDDDVQATLRQEVDQAIQQLGVTETHIRFRAMSDYDRAEISKTESQGEGRTEGSANPAKPVQEDMQARRQAEMRAQGMPAILEPEANVNFIAVASGKGGVGKSTVTVNLAVALARMGKRVGLMDADIYGFSVPDMMGIDQFPQMVDNSIIPVERFGVKVISMGFFVEDNAPVIWRGPMLGKMLRNFFNEVTWGELDYVLLDLPPGTGDIALDVHQMIPQSKEIVVTTPHATAAFVAARAGAMALHTNHEILGVIENMSYYECEKCGTKDYVFGKGGGAKLAEELNAELLAQIPLGAPDNHPSEADYSSSVYKADSATGKLYAEIAKRIVEKIED